MLIIGILSLLAYFIFARPGFSESKNILITILSVIVVVYSIFGILSSIKKARSVYDKVLTALIGNIVLNILFIIVLYFVVISLVK